MDLISFLFSEDDLHSLSIKENKEDSTVRGKYPLKVNLDFPKDSNSRIERISIFIEQDIWSQLKILLEHPMINQSALSEICQEYHLNLMKLMLKQKNTTVLLYPSINESNPSILNDLFLSFSNFYLKGETFKDEKLKLWSEWSLKDKRSNVEFKNNQSYKLIRRMKKDSFKLIMEHLDQWDLEIAM
jgi:hypothetical protein